MEKIKHIQTNDVSSLVQKINEQLSNNEGPLLKKVEGLPITHLLFPKRPYMNDHCTNDR